LRLTKALRKQLVAAAEKAGKSLNAEMVARLERSFQRDEADKILDDVQKHLEDVKRREELTNNTIAKLQAELQKASRWPAIIRVSVPSDSKPRKTRRKPK
jgi:hypothetical protein